MEVAVLPPQDCLKRHHHHHHHHNKPRRNPDPNSTNQTIRSGRRNRNSNSPPPPGPAVTHSLPATPTLTGPIRILKRGEDLVPPLRLESEVSCPVKPKPEAVRPVKAKPEVSGPVFGPMINGFYAGSACVTSPSPSELPLPVFFTRSCGLSMVTDVGNNNQKIASDLRRVLKLC